MARLHQNSDSEDSLPDVRSLLGLQRSPLKKHPQRGASNGQDRKAFPEVSNRTVDREQFSANLTFKSASAARVRPSPTKAKRRSQRPLGQATANPLLLPVEASEDDGAQDIVSPQKSDGPARSKVKLTPPLEPRTPRRAAKRVNHVISPLEDSDVASEAGKHENDSDEDDGLSDFVVSDNASDAELRLPPRSHRKPTQGASARTPGRTRRVVLSDDEDESGGENDERDPGQGDVLSAIRKLSLGTSSETTEQPVERSNISNITERNIKLEPNAILS